MSRDCVPVKESVLSEAILWKQIIDITWYFFQTRVGVHRFHVKIVLADNVKTVKNKASYERVVRVSASEVSYLSL